MSGPAQDLLGPIDRRTFLRGSAGGVVALAAATLLPAGCAGYPPIANLRLFTAKEFAVLEALADTFVPAAEGVASATALDIAGYLDRALSAQSALVRKQLKQALLLMEYGGFWWGPARSRFTRMSPTVQAHYVEEWLAAASPFRRQVGQLFRRAILQAYYSDERAWTGVGYDGPFV